MLADIKPLVEKQNSFCFRYGNTGSDLKIYFDSAEDLHNQLSELDKKAIDIKSIVESFKQKMGGSQ